jgi:hypothetical protein
MLISINRISELTGHSREHVRRTLNGMPFTAGKSQAKLYESKDVLTLRLASGDDRHITEAESRRLLNIEKTTLIRVQQESLRRVRIAIETVTEINTFCFSNIRGIILASRLDDQSKDDILLELQGVGPKIAALGPVAPKP